MVRASRITVILTCRTLFQFQACARIHEADFLRLSLPKPKGFWGKSHRFLVGLL